MAWFQASYLCKVFTSRCVIDSYSNGNAHLGEERVESPEAQSVEEPEPQVSAPAPEEEEPEAPEVQPPPAPSAPVQSAPEPELTFESKEEEKIPEPEPQPVEQPRELPQQLEFREKSNSNICANNCLISVKFGLYFLTCKELPGALQLYLSI